ncbi:transposase, partial [Corallococcus sp. RDP092CA]|uniref:transposase n=1 Tax=Corallococcus sp. RDP092CA TaxID=3109369 RepID=UPI0035AF5139
MAGISPTPWPAPANPRFRSGDAQDQIHTPCGRARHVRGGGDEARGRVGARRRARKVATSSKDATAQEVLDVYARRFTIEETFRDVKDLKFGMGLKQVRVKTPE